ncbi:MAG TPA: hypothetical protein VGJ84_05845 [Polyangiaceae bacterium]
MKTRAIRLMPRFAATTKNSRQSPHDDREDSPHDDRDVAQAHLRRAWRHRRRGEQRRAMLALRQACHAESNEPRLWTQYAVQCTRVGRVPDAIQALRHAIWLRERNGDPSRVKVTRALLAHLEHGEIKLPLRAA